MEKGGRGGVAKLEPAERGQQKRFGPGKESRRAVQVFFCCSRLPPCGRLTGITPCCCSKRRHRFPARPGNVSIRFDVASYLQGRAWISALRGLERDHQESVLHGPLAGAQKEGGAMPKLVESSAQRRKLLSAIERLAGVAIFETLSETYRTCGSDGSACSWSVGESSFCC